MLRAAGQECLYAGTVHQPVKVVERERAIEVERQNVHLASGALFLAPAFVATGREALAILVVAWVVVPEFLTQSFERQSFLYATLCEQVQERRDAKCAAFFAGRGRYFRLHGEPACTCGVPCRLGIQRLTMPA